jgi:MFS family permease
MTLFNVTNVFVSSAVPREHQGLGQGIFNTVVQIGTAISLAIAATVAHAAGVTVDATVEELLKGYQACFWLCVGILAPPILGCFFLKASKASENLKVNAASESCDGDKQPSPKVKQLEDTPNYLDTNKKIG